MKDFNGYIKQQQQKQMSHPMIVLINWGAEKFRKINAKSNKNVNQKFYFES